MMSEMDGKNEGIEFEMERYRQQQQAQNFFLNSYETKSESGSSDILSRPQTPNSLYNNINDVINQQIESIPINNISGGSNVNQMGPPKKFQLNKIFDKSYESNSSSSNSSTSSGKRANRTRFTDYQIKVLQEFFENNSYPKDSDLEYLSKLLLLSPRVIVVWFQVSFAKIITHETENNLKFLFSTERSSKAAQDLRKPAQQHQVIVTKFSNFSRRGKSYSECQKKFIEYFKSFFKKLPKVSSKALKIVLKKLSKFPLIQIFKVLFK